MNSVGSLAAGAVTNLSASGWRYIFWIQVALHGITSLGLFAFYWPKKRTDYPRMSFEQWAWACDPIGSFLLVSAATLLLLALNWAGGAYPWSNPHVCVNLTVGIVLFLAFCLYGTVFPPYPIPTTADQSQNGKEEATASSPMSSFPRAPTSGFPPLPSPSKAGSTTRPLTL